MPRLIWTPVAMQGLQRVYLFLAEKDTDAADQALRIIKRHANMLAEFPNAGRPQFDMEPEHREFLIPFGGSGYTLLYQHYGSDILVLSVKHQKEAGFTL